MVGEISGTGPGQVSGQARQFLESDITNTKIIIWYMVCRHYDWSIGWRVHLYSLLAIVPNGLKMLIFIITGELKKSKASKAFVIP